ncbi:MAG: lytic transglycosylase domain-containing protein [Acetobacteraceae bacterium]|nr:lytic transglycosylase domain-containing protein [Acetobacteraceae bacterium]
MMFPWLPVATLRLVFCLAAIGLLAACSSRTHVARTASDYAAHAKGDYSPPGPPEDPWGPYIVKAAARFDVPQRWIREVMRVESGGKQYQGGRLTTSGAGAMGLMQVMPATYEELRQRHGLDDDPYHPYDNIMAGTAYIREMYDLYGAPGFLAAYNAGPRRFEDYAFRNRSLPTETRRYVARIAPNITADRPQHESDAAVLAMYQIPSDIPAGPRYPRGRQPAPVALARAETPRESALARGAADRTVVTATNLPPPAAAARPMQMAAAATAPATPARARGFSLITPAMAGTLAVRPAAVAGLVGPWAIQVGAFSSEGLARAAAQSARGQARDVLSGARPAVGPVRSGRATLYRARLGGLSREAAMQACEKLSRGRGACIVLSPDAQL